MKHVATIESYKRKDGGFRGTFRDHEKKEGCHSDVLPTREEAMYWAKMEAHKRFAERGYRTASIRFRKGSTSYRANIWAP